MEFEQQSRRLARPALITLLLSASLGIPAYLWLTRGRDLPLQVVLDPARYVVGPGERVPLRLRVSPGSARSQLELQWSGEGVQAGGEVWVAPTRPGSYTARVTARLSGTVVRDAVTFQVPRVGPAKLALARPRPEPEPARDLPPPCRGRPPRVKLHGKVCSGGNLVVEVPGWSGAVVWHQLEAGGAVRFGAWAELVLPGAGTLVTRVVPTGAGCTWTVRTRLDPAGCRAGPRQGGVFADFSWELISAGCFRFAAKPSRTPGLTFSRYRWDFGDGTRKEMAAPRVAHCFEAPLRRHNLVWLEVVAGERTARAARLVSDRTVD